MNDRYLGIDLDSYGTSGYQRSNPSSIVQQPRQQRYTRGPSMDDYDPTRLLDSVNMAAYSPTVAGTGVVRAPATHRTVMPTVAAAPANGMAMRGVTDFEPIPISTATLQRLITDPIPATRSVKGVNNALNVAANTQKAMSTPLSEAFPAGKRQKTPKRESWLDELKMEVSGLSLEPMSGTEVLERLETRSSQVMTRYLPCVDFLVQCQQELRKGLAEATRKRMGHHMFRDGMTPRQFYNTYVANMPERFYRKNRRTMKSDDLSLAVKELQKLCADARGAERQGCEVIKNTFLGGMKDGESWGLRRWLSKQGGALHICNDCECILHSCQKLDRSLESTRKLAAKLRPLAKKALIKLKADVPSSYQEHSSAHPYLPFFHRLEAALKGMSSFDPEDDDVICIDDDDEVEQLKSQAPPPPKRSRKRKAGGEDLTDAKKRAVQESTFNATGAPNSDDDSVVEILDVKPPSRPQKLSDGLDSTNGDGEYMRALLKTFDDDGSSSGLFGGNSDFESDGLSSNRKDPSYLAAGLDRLAVMFDSNQATLVRPTNIAAAKFWDEERRFASALRLFSEILRNPEADSYLERIDESEMIALGNPPYSQIIRHPLCFRDIAASLMEESDDMNRVTSKHGILPSVGLEFWNMWRGDELLQAIDLVFLNSLAYGKAMDEGRSPNRSKTNKLRKVLWAGIKKVVDMNVSTMSAQERRDCTPTRRGESSGFVVHKGRS